MSKELSHVLGSGAKNLFMGISEHVCQPGPDKDKKSPEVDEELSQFVPGGAVDGVLGLSEHTLRDQI